jgi:hypothetical protein
VSSWCGVLPALLVLVPALAFAAPAPVLTQVRAELRARQGKDGGFPYHPGGMGFADATAWSMLALAGFPDVQQRGRAFLSRCWRQGGCAAFPADPDPGWMTSPAVLALLRQDPKDPLGLAGVRWLVEDDRAQSEPGKSAPGWPWSPGCAPWVETTAITIYCLAESGRGAGPRVQEGLAMMARNQAKGGGWSLYATRGYGYHTGLVLLAYGALAEGKVPHPSPNLEEAATFLAKKLDATRSLLDLAVGTLALARRRHKAARALSERLAAQLATVGRGTLETAFGLLALQELELQKGTP